MEAVCHGTLEGGFSVFYIEGNYSVCECAPRGGERSFVLVFLLDPNLVVSEKIVHEGKDLMSDTHVNDLVNEQCWKIVFGTSQIQIPEVHANSDGALFFVHGNRVGNPGGVCDGIDETGCAQFLYFFFDCNNFGSMDGTLLLVYKNHIWTCVYVVLHN